MNAEQFWDLVNRTKARAGAQLYARISTLNESESAVAKNAASVKSINYARLSFISDGGVGVFGLLSILMALDILPFHAPSLWAFVSLQLASMGMGLKIGFRNERG